MQVVTAPMSRAHAALVEAAVTTLARDDTVPSAVFMEQVRALKVHALAGMGATLHPVTAGARLDPGPTSASVPGKLYLRQTQLQWGDCAGGAGGAGAKTAGSTRAPPARRRRARPYHLAADVCFQCGAGCAGSLPCGGPAGAASLTIRFQEFEHFRCDACAVGACLLCAYAVEFMAQSHVALSPVVRELCSWLLEEAPPVAIIVCPHAGLAEFVAGACRRVARAAVFFVSDVLAVSGRGTRAGASRASGVHNDADADADSDTGPRAAAGEGMDRAVTAAVADWVGTRRGMRDDRPSLVLADASMGARPLPAAVFGMARCVLAVASHARGLPEEWARALKALASARRPRTTVVMFASA
jgi:hypothetical protein